MGGIIRPPLYLTAKLRNNWELGIRNRVFFAYPAQWGHDPLLYLPLCGRNQTASVLLFSAPLARSGNNSAFLLQVTDFFCNFAAANQKNAATSSRGQQRFHPVDFAAFPPSSEPLDIFVQFCLSRNAASVTDS